MGIFFKKKDAASLVAEGMALAQGGKSEQAIAKLKEATELDPKHAQAWYMIGALLSAAGRYEEAVGCYAKSAANAPADKKALPLYNMGNALQALGKMEDALEFFTMTTKFDPGFADAWINRGRLLDDAGKHLEAIASYDTALKLAPKDAMAMGNRGNSLRSLKRFKEAKASYEASLAIEANPMIEIGLGACLSSLGNPEQGLKLMDAALKQGRYPPGLVERAIVLAALKRYEEALASVDEAIRQGERAIMAFHNRGEILGRLGKWNEAVKSFDEALKMDAKYTPSLFGKARVLCNAKAYGPAKATIDLYFKYSDGTDGNGEGAKAVVALCRNGGVG